MADDFANGRNFFGEIRLDSHFPVPSFAGGLIGWPLPSWKEAMMLSVCRKGDYLTGTLLSPAEDGATRKAFGRFATPDARESGAEVVRRRGVEKWFRCDCLDGLEARPPMLIPVMESYIGRHTDPPWPTHAESCDFFREPAEQRGITKCYGPPSPGTIAASSVHRQRIDRKRERQECAQPRRCRAKFGFPKAAVRFFTSFPPDGAIVAEIPQALGLIQMARNAEDIDDYPLRHPHPRHPTPHPPPGTNPGLGATMTFSLRSHIRPCAQEF